MSNVTWRMTVVVMMLNLAACGGGSKNSNSPLAPSAGGSSPASGVWTGTITRPAGLGTISVRWEAANGTIGNIPGLTGPMTLTNGAASITVTANGITSGNDKDGYKIHLDFQSKSGDSPAFPACSIVGSDDADPWPSPYTSISAPAFNITYNGCRGFIDTGYSNAQACCLQEAGSQLSMHK
jgi:hypothetical protein